MSKKRNFIWDYFSIDPKDDKKLYAVLVASLSVVEELVLKT